MFKEYFKSGWFSWFGLAVLVFHSFFAAWMKKRLNGWYGSFYDLLQEAGADIGSGAAPEQQAAVKHEIVEFAWIVAPLLIVHPVSKYIRSVWVLDWRLTLINSYLSRWDPDARRLEGSSQRIQEDTARLASGFDAAVGTVLDSILTLFIFVPVLHTLGGEATPPQALGFLGHWWLVVVAVGTAALHLGGAWRIGTPLVALEVANQRIEASFRRRLVLDESMPAGTPTEEAKSEMSMWNILHQIKQNYMRLYRNFFSLNVFLATFDQCMIVLPYLIVAPLLFAASENRVKLGTLVKVSNSFDRVFGALTVVAENWAAVQDFRSTLHRLREFEAAFDKRPMPHTALIQPAVELRSDAVQRNAAQEDYTDPGPSSKNGHKE